jgi:glyoxylase-like metal-dependent hydrolase (beta-lactamase superfamily II)
MGMMLNNVEKIADDLYVIRQDMRPGWYCSVIVIFGEDKIGVIDTGYENTPMDYVFPLIQEKGRSLEDVDLVVNTHRDGDHIRGNMVFKEQTSASIAVHGLEAEAVPSADIMLKDGERVTLGGRNFNVIHTPGHRPGAICLLDKKHKLLITGDSVCGTREDLIRMDREIYIKSLKKLLDVDADMMIMSHPFMPAEKNILEGPEILEMIKESIKIAEQFEQD